jgi:hypothetical protein
MKDPTVLDVMFRGLAPVIIGLLGLWIALQQYKTNRQKLELDLYDKRIKLYNYIMSAIYAAQTKQRDEIYAKYQELDFHFHEISFLFDKAIEGEIYEIVSKINELIIVLEDNEQRIREKTLKPADRHKAVETREWFNNKKATLKSLFEPYLSFAKISGSGLR